MNNVLENDHVTLSPVDLERDLVPLYAAASLTANGVDLFEFHVNIPPMVDLPTFETYLTKRLSQTSEVVYKVWSRRLGKLVGCISLMNIRPDHRVVEVGSVWYAREAQRTEINSNAMLLLFTHVFEVLKYRRLEWKCNSRNEASMKAAVRLGFQYEGLFRQHFLSRGENRDTVWYSIVDHEWDEKKAALEQKCRAYQA